MIRLFDLEREFFDFLGCIAPNVFSRVILNPFHLLTYVSFIFFIFQIENQKVLFYLTVKTLILTVLLKSSSIPCVPFLKIAHTMYIHNLIKNLFDFALVRLK